MSDLQTQSAADVPEWERHGFESKEEMDYWVYKLENERAEERIRFRP
jgi:hypothetical protein